MFGRKKSEEQIAAENKAKELQKRRKTLMQEISNYVRKGWAAGDVDAEEGTATLTRSTTSTIRKTRRLVTFGFLTAAHADRTETMFLYLDEKGRVKASKSRKGIIS